MDVFDVNQNRGPSNLTVVVICQSKNSHTFLDGEQHREVRRYLLFFMPEYL